MRYLNFLLSILWNFIVGFVFALVCIGDSPLLLATSGAISVAIGFAMGYINHRGKNGGVAFSGLQKEVWLPDVKEQFYPPHEFLNAGKDFSGFVNNHAINLAELAITDPVVLINNTSLPIPVVQPTDTALQITLKRYSTQSTLVTDAVAKELAYDQKSYYIKRHQNSLFKQMSADAAMAWSPLQDSEYNAVISPSSSDPQALINAIIKLKSRFRKINAFDQMNLVLCPEHEAAISGENVILYKDFSGMPGAELFGFRLWFSSQCPYYTTSSGVKVTDGTPFNSSIHSNASFAFRSDEVGKALGEFDFYYILKHPDYQGDVFNFSVRAATFSIRSKYMGAIFL
jgi:hypothetical protein